MGYVILRTLAMSAACSSWCVRCAMAVVRERDRGYGYVSYVLNAYRCKVHLVAFTHVLLAYHLCATRIQPLTLSVVI
jgi:hypothetical protein